MPSRSDELKFECAERPSGDSDMRRMRESSTRPMDDLSMAFEGSRKAVNTAIDMICEFTGSNLGRSLNCFRRSHV